MAATTLPSEILAGASPLNTVANEEQTGTTVTQNGSTSATQQQPSTAPNPSRVIHVTNINSTATSDTDLESFFSNFGKVERLIYMRSKGQALVQFEDISVSASVISQLGQNESKTAGPELSPSHLHGRELRVGYSVNQELDGSSSGARRRQPRGRQHGGHQYGHDQVGASGGPYRRRIPGYSVSQPGLGSFQDGVYRHAQPGGSRGTYAGPVSAPRGPRKVATPNRIILATIERPLRSVTTDDVYEIFSSFGHIEKVVVFVKNVLMHVLVQFSVQADAEIAVTKMQGIAIHDEESGKLDMTFSNLSELVVKENGSRTKDFENSSLPVSELAPLEPPKPKRQFARFPGVVHPPPPPPQDFGEVMEPLDGYEGGYIPSFQPALAGIDLAQANHYSVNGMANGAGYSEDRFNSHGTGLSVGSNSGPRGGSTGLTSVVLVLGIDPNIVTCDQLFNLFSLYGDVVRVKKLRKAADHALVQMASPAAAVTAISMLRDLELFGSPVDIRPSKHSYVALRTEEQDEFATDYSASPLNRFHRNPEKALKYMTAPTNVLHISNLPEAVLTEQELRGYLDQFAESTAIKFFVSGGRKQALVQFPSPAVATTVLIQAHNSQFLGGHIRVAFSKNSL